jgi:hypothetical protein
MDLQRGDCQVDVSKADTNTALTQQVLNAGFSLGFVYIQTTLTRVLHACSRPISFAPGNANA